LIFLYPQAILDEMNHSLEVYHIDSLSPETPQEALLFFSSDGKWLHPLFELEDFLQEKPAPPEALYLKDRIIGKASAMLIIRLGIRKIHAATLSLPAKEFLLFHNAVLSWDLLVDKIACLTEELLRNEEDVEKAWTILKQRAAAGRNIR
jgi:hypothetical protein